MKSYVLHIQTNLVETPLRLNLNGLNFNYYSFGYKRMKEVGRGAGSTRLQSISDNAFYFYFWKHEIKPAWI